MGDPSGLPEAFAALRSNDINARRLAADTLGMVADARTGLPALDQAYAGELDPRTKNVIDLARSQLRARLGVKATAPAAQARPAGAVAKSGPKKKGPGKKKPPPAAAGKAPRAPARPR
jgi:hypothetical protein